MDRLRLRAQAIFWRTLSDFGFFLNNFAPPRPIPPAFTMTIPATLSGIPGTFELYFYAPENYPIPNLPSVKNVFRGLGNNQVRPSSEGGNKYAVLFNFHGGGFTIGSATDDRRWFSHVLRNLRNPETGDAGVLICSVEYRRAPEFPFPTAVYDGADAILYVLQHADEFHVDARKVCTSGFSAGGNLSFTVLLKLWDELAQRKGLEAPIDEDPVVEPAVSDPAISSIDGTIASPSSSSSSTSSSPSSTTPALPHTHTPSTTSSRKSLPNLTPHLTTTLAFYPSTDFTLPRSVRRATNKKPSAELPLFFTQLFDSSYLYPPTNISTHNPYLSPIVATDEALIKALPPKIVIYPCEWDELRDEGERFAERLKGLGKDVGVRLVVGKGHAWDKDPFGRNPVRDEVYDDACRELAGALGLEYVGRERGKKGVGEEGLRREM
ncbi:hypothetical protein HDV00_005910 [Rhizophlyctis rosea]|nr:hypothetical protein HDV00_005910 [Rhizophlyctis rosea]